MADELNFQLPPGGFDSYLNGILPQDQAVLAGAFSVAMQQIRDINKVADTPTFAKVVYSMENTVGLPSVNGTDVPTNQPLQQVAQRKEALGSGAYGTYTMSNFFGAMSGLPYPWKDLFNSIKELQTQKLINIYQELFLGVTWEYAEAKITQPYWTSTSPGFPGSIAQPYVEPTVSANPANPNYQPDPDLPNYDPIPYINGSTGSPTYSPSYYSNGGQPAIWDWYYEIGSITLTEDGGGFGRGTAPNPNVPIAVRTGRSGRTGPDTTINVPCGSAGLDGWCSPTGARATAPVGRNPEDCASVGRKSYGRVTLKASRGSPYAWRTGDSQATINWVDLTGQDTLDNPPRTPILYPGYPGKSENPRDQTFVAAQIPRETIEIQDPPIAMLPVTDSGKATNGVNMPGRVYADPFIFPGLGGGLQAVGTTFWPDPGNAVVQGYIDQANTEIQAIKTRNADNLKKSTILNTLWDITGIALKHEQRARYNALNPVSVPWDRRSSNIPMSQNVFVDALPEYAKQTEPHMAVQTLEHICNTDTVGGQSIIALLRQERNQARLQEVGIQLDNNMPSTMNIDIKKRLMLNGTVPGAIEGVPSNTLPNTIPGEGEYPPPIYTIPSNPTNVVPINYYDTPNGTIKVISNLTPGNIAPILSGDPNPIVNPLVPVGPGDNSDNNGDDENNRPINPFVPNPNIDPFPPLPINTDYTGSTTIPSTYSVNDAINKVIECNCDCWVN